MNQGSRKISRRRLSQAIAEALLADPTSRHRQMRQLAAYLVEHRMQQQAGLIMNDIARELLIRGGQLQAELDTARKLSDHDRELLEQFMKRQTGASSVALTSRVHPDLVGGFILRTPEAELDTTVRRSLTKLATIA